MTDNQWLAQVQEQILEPDLKICDPHHHLWDYPHNRYLFDELLADLRSGHNVMSTVFMECASMYRADGPDVMKPVGETEFVQGVAAQSASGQFGDTAVAAGIVSNADFSLGDAVAPVLEAHMAASGNRFRGIRFSLSWDASPEITPASSRTRGLLSDPKFREGFAYLQRYGLSFDALVYHPQLTELVDLANAFPEVTFILNHIGRPLGTGPYAGKRDEVFADWKKGITAIAACPNVVVKVGGLGNTISGFDWHQRPLPPTSTELAKTMAPYYLFCIEQFGANRCMFESNFPVDKASYSYTVLWNAFKRITRDFSKSELTALFHDTAAKAYRLPEIGGE